MQLMIAHTDYEAPVRAAVDYLWTRCVDDFVLLFSCYNWRFASIITLEQPMESLI